MFPRSVPSFSWSSDCAPAPAPRVIDPAICRLRAVPLFSHAPCALRHLVAPVNYGQYAEFTRESLSSGL